MNKNLEASNIRHKMVFAIKSRNDVSFPSFIEMLANVMMILEQNSTFQFSTKDFWEASAKIWEKTFLKRHNFSSKILLIISLLRNQGRLNFSAFPNSDQKVFEA